MSGFNEWNDDSESDSDSDLSYDSDIKSDYEIMCGSVSDTDSETDEYTSYGIISACKDYDIKRIKRYIYNRKELDPELKYHQRPIEYAFENEDMEIVDLLIKKGHVSPKGLLEFAIQNNRLDLVENILPYYNYEFYWFNQSYVSPSFYKQKYRMNTGCVLNLACKYGNIDIVDTILAHPNFKYCGIEGIRKNDMETEWSTFIDCVYHGRVDMIDRLVVNGANYHRILNDGRNALHIATEKGFIEIVKKLYGYGLDINVKDNNEITPLMIAREKGYDDIIKFLIDKGATEI